MVGRTFPKHKFDSHFVESRCHFLQISFVIGTTLAMLSAYWLGYRPETFNRSIYTGAAVVLFTLRYAIYRVKKWHYYGDHSCCQQLSSARVLRASIPLGVLMSYIYH